MGKLLAKCFQKTKVQRQNSDPIVNPEIKINLEDVKRNSDGMWRELTQGYVLNTEGSGRLHKRLRIDPDAIEGLYLTYFFDSPIASLSNKKFLSFNQKYLVVSFESMCDNIKHLTKKLNTEYFLFSSLEMKNFFRFLFTQNAEKGKNYLEGDKAIELYKVAVLNNPSFEGPLPTRFFMYLKANRELGTINFDEWENIPIFLMEYAAGLQTYEDNTALPSMFDNFVNGMSSIRVRLHDD